MYVDAIDANILRLLQSNGRATLEELSQATGRSSSQCQRRQKRLESVGIIKRYVALVAPDAVGYPVQVFTLVSVERDEADTFDRFEEAIRAEPTIIHAAIVAGTSDILFWAVARDLAGYRGLLRRLTDAFPTLRSVTTFVMLEEIKPGFAVPVEALGDEEPVSRDHSPLR
jgi:Lrp/AsnC family leucine-responsive transcriptional regulator